MRAGVALSLALVVVAGCRGDLRPSGSSGAPPTEKPTPSATTTPPKNPRTKVAPAPPREVPPSIGALTSRVFVRSAPRPSSPEIGVLHVGAVVRLRSTDAGGKDGCAGGWYPVEPEGWVCLDASTTLDVANDPIIAMKRAHHGDFDRSLPFHWSVSKEALLYKKVPSREEQDQAEYQLAEHLAQAERLRDSRTKGEPDTRVPYALDGVDLGRAKGDIPALLDDGAVSPAFLGSPADRRARARGIPTRSSIAWTDEFFANGRSWVLTDDLLVAPKDKLVPERPSKFAGVHLEDGRVQLPIAFIRFDPQPKFHLLKEAADLVPVSYTTPIVETEPSESTAPESDDPLSGYQLDTRPGTLLDTGETWSRLSWVGLTGRYRKQGRHRFLETSDGEWIREQDATLVEERPPRGFELDGDEKWIDVSIFKGTLVAYEGTRAVFATLISPGANGYKRVDGKNAKFTTPTGTYRIEWKHRSTTMTPDPERMSYYLSEVPYTQFFHMPFALHAAYWHDRFGEPKSGGCVNLSPKDAKWLFDWTTPHVPAGWHSVRSGDTRGPGTWVRVR
jgi:hypothetical protein